MYNISQLMQAVNAVAFTQIQAALQIPAPAPNPAAFQLPTIPEEDEEQENINAQFLEPWPS